MSCRWEEPDHDDETACDACGQPTPRLNPPADTELCNICWKAEQHAEQIRATNDATYIRAIRHFFGLDRQEADRASRKGAG
jgi:hypothetical protein